MTIIARRAQLAAEIQPETLGADAEFPDLDLTEQRAAAQPQLLQRQHLAMAAEAEVIDLHLIQRHAPGQVDFGQRQRRRGFLVGGRIRQSDVQPLKVNLADIDLSLQQCARSPVEQHRPGLDAGAVVHQGEVLQTDRADQAALEAADLKLAGQEGPGLLIAPAQAACGGREPAEQCQRQQ